MHFSGDLANTQKNCLDVMVLLSIEIIQGLSFFSGVLHKMNVLNKLTQKKCKTNY